jgi:DNA-binding transcriptional ArsR family regulator
VDAVLQALSDPSRRTILDALSGGPATANELAALLPIARPGASRHLRVLRDAGLVDVHQEAQFRIYSLRAEPLAEVSEWLDRYKMLWAQRMDALHTEIARGKRQIAPVKPQIAPVKPQIAPVKPQIAQVKPQIAQVKPQIAQVKPQRRSEQ